MQEVRLQMVAIENPDELNFILGQTHFIKSVEDIYEAIVGTVPQSKFGLAFCEASGECKIRWDGNDKALQNLAVKNAENLGAGHCFIVFLKECFPINILKSLQAVPEVCNIFCATANPTKVVLAESSHGGRQGRGILGVIDGFVPAGVETAKEKAWRYEFLRSIGYKK